MERPQSTPFRARFSPATVWIRLAVLVECVFLVCAAGAFAQSGTTTSLSVTSGGAPVTTVRQGTLVTLTATVIAANGTPVSPGQVQFCEVQAPPLRCTDIRLLATAQLSRTGVATYKLYPGPGTHAYQAIFLRTNAVPAGSSPPAPLTVTPFYTTTTALTAGPVTASGYTLTATVTGAQGTVPPTGTVTFEDASNGNYVLGTASLVPGAAAGPSGLSFAIQQDIPASEACLTALVADVNGDGRPDLVLGLNSNVTFGSYVDTVEIFLGNGDGTFTRMPALPVALNTIALAVGDFNGDGKPDLVAFGVTPAPGFEFIVANQAQVFLGNGDGTFTAGQVLANPQPNQQYPALDPPGNPPYPANMANPTIAVGDFNGDGIADIVFTTYSKETVIVYFGNGDGTFRAGPSTFAGLNADGLAVGDFNGDGKADLAITNPTANGRSSTLSILLGNGDGTFTAATPLTAVTTQSAAIVTADFNGDGILDLAAESWLPRGEVELFQGNGDGTFTTSAQSPITGTSNNGSVLAVGDFNGDGKADLVTAGGNQFLSLLLGNGDGTFQLATGVAAATFRIDAISGVAVGDFVGSGLSGIVSADYDNFDATVLLPQLTAQGTVLTSSAVLSGVTIAGSSPHDIIAIYSGSSTYQASTSPPLLLPAQPVAATVTLTVNPVNSNYGQPVVLTATIAPSTAQDHNATGTVTFLAAGRTQGTAPVVNGVASFTSTLLPVGTNFVEADYSGDAYFAAGTAYASETVTGYNSASTLTPTPNPSYVGQAVIITAAVTGVGSAAIPAGAVTFYDNATVIGRGTLDATGHASMTTSVLALGRHSLSFVYAGDLGFYPSTSPAVIQFVNAQGSDTTLTVGPNPAGIGQQVGMTAGVTLSIAGTASGTIAFYDGATQIDQTTLDATGHATYTTTALALGTHILTAVYAGTANFGGSTSPAVTETIQNAGFTMQLAAPAITLRTYQHTTTAVTLTSLGNFADKIALTCGNLPTYVTCTFTPNPAALAGNGTATVSLYLDTDSIVGLGGAAHNQPGPLHSNPFNLALAISPLSLLALLRSRRRPSRSRPTLALLTLLTLPLALALGACGGDIITPIASAAPGTYTIPITATGTSTAIAHTTQLTLTVTP